MFLIIQKVYLLVSDKHARQLLRIKTIFKRVSSGNVNQIWRWCLQASLPENKNCCCECKCFAADDDGSASSSSCGHNPNSKLTACCLMLKLAGVFKQIGCCSSLNGLQVMFSELWLMRTRIILMLFLVCLLKLLPTTDVSCLFVEVTHRDCLTRWSQKLTSLACCCTQVKADEALMFYYTPPTHNQSRGGKRPHLHWNRRENWQPTKEGWENVLRCENRLQESKEEGRTISHSLPLL